MFYQLLLITHYKKQTDKQTKKKKQETNKQKAL